MEEKRVLVLYYIAMLREILLRLHRLHLPVFLAHVHSHLESVQSELLLVVAGHKVAG